MKRVSDIPMRFIEHSLEQGIEVAKQERDYLEGDCKNLYFAGRTLFIDTKDKNGSVDCITLCHADETLGWFSDGTFRRLMSIKACRLMEELMNLCGIKHEPKWIQ